jgi:hypothetical protein
MTGEDMIDPVTGEDMYEDDSPPPSMGAGHEARGAFGEQDPEPTRSNLFPSAVKEYEDRFSQPAGSIGQSVKDFGAVGLAAAGDVAGLAQRGAAALFTDQRMSDPGAHVLKPQTDAAVEDAKSHLGGYRDVPYPSGPDMGPQMGPAMVEMAGRTVDDPMTWVTPFLKGVQVLGKGGLAAIEKAAPGFTKAAEALSRWNGRSAEKLSGVPLEALEAYRDPAKRALMKQNFGAESEIGNEFLDKLNNYDQFLPETKGIDQALEKMPPISTEGAVKAMEGAKQKPVAGVYSPIDQAGNAKAEPWIDFIRGGAQPEDLIQTTKRAAQELEQASGTAKATGAEAAANTREAERALKAQVQAQRQAGQAANEVKNLPDKGKGFWRWHENEEQVAKDAAGKAKEAAIDARAKLAVGEISKADYAAAKATEASAERNLQIVGSARKLFNGQNQKEVAQELSRGGMKVEDIQEVLTKARERAQSIPELESEIPAAAYREKRKRLDANINFDDKADDIVQRIQKAGRTEMMQTLERVAEESGNPEFRDLMKSYSKKVQLVDDLKAYIGQTKGANKRKVQQFFDHLLGKNGQNKQEIIESMDRIMGTNTLERARAAQQAQQIGHDGEAAWFPMHNTGAMGAGQQWLGRIGFMWSSPVIASRFTLPAFSKVEALAKKFGNAIPPKAGKLVTAIERAENPAKAAPLVNQLIQVLEAESKLPDNVVPFRKVAENDDSTRYSRK